VSHGSSNLTHCLFGVIGSDFKTSLLGHLNCWTSQI
jgi:hypothetical protein